MADSSYESEVKSIQAFLNMQHPSGKPAIAPSQINFQSEDFVAPRFLKKLKTKTVSFLWIVAIMYKPSDLHNIVARPSLKDTCL